MTLEEVQGLVIVEAKKYLGVREHGYNSGPEVEMFQKAVDGKATQESWCMAYVQYCIKKVCAQVGIKEPLYSSEGCLDVWNHTADAYKNHVGGPGQIVIFQHGDTIHGHTGICEDAGKIYIHTIEGNTNSAGSREGDGVYEKVRTLAGSPSLKTKGFIDVSQMIYDSLQTIHPLAA